MAKSGCILRQTKEGWQIAAATAAPAIWHALASNDNIVNAQDSEQLVKKAAEFVRTHHLSNRIALVVDSATALAGRFSVAGPGELRDRRALGYRMEELLPVAAEEFVADYIHKGNEVLGVAVATDDLSLLVASLEEQGLKVQSISPAAICALQSFLDQAAKTNQSNVDLIVWQNGLSVELFRMGPSSKSESVGRIDDWRHLPNSDPSAVAQEVAAIHIRFATKDASAAFSIGLKLLVIDADSKLRETLKRLGRTDVVAADTAPFAEHLRRGATAALSGRVKPWIELRREALAAGDPHRAVRREWQWCLAALAVLLLSIATFFWMRRFQYEHLARDVQQRQEDLYREIFPGTQVPVAVASRLRSEHVKLLGARGQEAAVRLPPSALNVLHELVSGMPQDVRWQVEQVRIEDGQIDLDLNVRSVGKAGAIAAALQSRGFDVEPPRTEQNESETVAVRIHGVHASDTSAATADVEADQ